MTQPAGQSRVPEPAHAPARALRAVTELLGWAGIAALLVPTVLVCADIIWRRAVGGAFMDIFDITQLSLVICASWCIPYAFMHGTHVSVDLLVERFPARWQRTVDTLSYLAAALLLGLLFWFAWQSMLLHRSYGDTTQNLGISVLYYWGAFLVGMALSVVACLWRAFSPTQRSHGAPVEPAA